MKSLESQNRTKNYATEHINAMESGHHVYQLKRKSNIEIGRRGSISMEGLDIQASGGAPRSSRETRDNRLTMGVGGHNGHSGGQRFYTR